MTDPTTLVRELAAAHGFQIVGITPADADPQARDALARWWDAGHGAAMGWMGRDPARRADPRALLPKARSVVVVAVDYGTAHPAFEAEGRYGRVARYAWGLDYHDVLLDRLRALGQAIADGIPGTGRTKAACDHSPLMERALAARAGLGFFGKNTCLLLPRRGSFVFLAELLLDVELEPTSPEGTDHCGTCRSCLAACPTDAFPAPHVLDARRCISYLTIEHRGSIPHDLRARLGPWVFGCDVCQDVCPFNRFSVDTAWPEFGPDAGVGMRLDLVEALSLETEAAFRARFADSPLLRPKRAGLLRNAAVAARNTGADGAVPILAVRAARDEDPVIRGHALWALFGLDDRRARVLAERALARDPDPDVRAEAEAGLAGH